MGGGKGADEAADEAKRARNEEAARQARIRQGTGDIDRIFSGGTGVTGQLAKGAAYDPGQDILSARRHGVDAACRRCRSGGCSCGADPQVGRHFIGPGAIQQPRHQWWRCRRRQVGWI